MHRCGAFAFASSSASRQGLGHRARAGDMSTSCLHALWAIALLACGGTDPEEAAPNDPNAADEGLPSLIAPPDVAAPPDDADVTASGLASRRLVVGSGDAFPRATEQVRVHYSEIGRASCRERG